MDGKNALRGALVFCARARLHRSRVVFDFGHSRRLVDTGERTNSGINVRTIRDRSPVLVARPRARSAQRRVAHDVPRG
jgi:hypothetical protein